ncbi:hypothetical protein [Bosea beijingensis]|jgi:hypothetical protein
MAIVNGMGFMARLRVAGKGIPGARFMDPRQVTRRFGMAAAEKEA